MIAVIVLGVIDPSAVSVISTDAPVLILDFSFLKGPVRLVGFLAGCNWQWFCAQNLNHVS